MQVFGFGHDSVPCGELVHPELNLKSFFNFISSQNGERDNRRYNFVRFENGTQFGHDVMCFKAEKTTVQSWISWLEFGRCSTCFCYCDEPGEDSDRYFSLREMVSDVKANKSDLFLFPL